MSTAIVIPPDSLAPDTLRNLAQEFVTRDGTDYGSEEVSLFSKTEQVLAQIRSGRVLIVYDDDTQSCNLLSDEQARALPLAVREDQVK